jgi:hypothetical protein
MFGLPRIQSIVAGGLLAIIIGLTVALLIANGNTRHWQKLDTLHSAQRDTEIAKNAVNLESITRLSDALDAKNAESEARAKAYADVKASDAATIADLDKRYAATKASRDALQAIAKVATANPSCRVPSALSGALEGL